MPKLKGDILTCDLCDETEIAADAEEWVHGKEGRIYCFNCTDRAERLVHELAPRHGEPIVIAQRLLELVDVMLWQRFQELQEDVLLELAERHKEEARDMEAAHNQ